ESIPCRFVAPKVLGEQPHPAHQPHVVPAAGPHQSRLTQAIALEARGLPPSPCHKLTARRPRDELKRLTCLIRQQLDTHVARPPHQKPLTHTASHRSRAAPKSF